MEDFNKIYNDNHKIVLGYVAQKLNDYSLAEEITNDVFIRVNNTLHTFDEEKATIRTFIMASAKNAVIDQYRKRKLETISLNKDLENDDSKSMTLANRIVCNTPTPYEALNSKERMEGIDNAIANLSKTDFEIAYYFFKEELSHQEICEEMNLSLGTVKGKIFRAKKVLQENLVTF